jgi:hypothetical protein
MALAMNHVSPGEEILEVVEIEIFAVEEKPLPRARHYVIRPVHGAPVVSRSTAHIPANVVNFLFQANFLTTFSAGISASTYLPRDLLVRGSNSKSKG